MDEELYGDLSEEQTRRLIGRIKFLHFYFKMHEQYQLEVEGLFDLSDADARSRLEAYRKEVE